MVLEKFAAFVAGLGESALPEDVAHHARRCLIDWFAAAIPGGALAPATLLAAALAPEADAGRARLVPSGARAGLRAAALINGAAAHVLEVDDIFREAVYHPGAPVIAAALAVAQQTGASGAALLRALVAGYEVSTRIGAAVAPAHYRFWHPTGTVGGFGAAAAAALLLGLDKARTLHALANAGTFAAGLQQAFRGESMSKPLHAGRAAETGVLVALAAGEGVSGAPDILDGPRGFGAAMSGEVDWAAATDGLGTRWNVTRITQKNHAACGHTFAAIDAALALKAAHGIGPAEVERIDIGTYGAALEVAGNPDPRTAFEAKFSLPYCVAVALATGSVRLAAFAPERLRNEEVRALMGRIALRLDDEAEAAFPGRRAAVVEIETADGARYRHRAPTRKGDPDDPLSDEALVEKYHELVAPVIGAAPAEALLATLWRIEEAADMAALEVAAPGAAAVAE